MLSSVNKLLSYTLGELEEDKPIIMPYEYIFEIILLSNEWKEQIFTLSITHSNKSSGITVK